MAFVVAPAMRIRNIKWSLKRQTQVNTGAYTGVRQVVATPWYSQWLASVQLAPMIGEANARSLRSFLARAKGSLNTFRLPATETPQNANVNVTVVSTAAQGATSLSIAGYTTALLDGQFFTVNGQLCQCTADQSGAVLTFEPPLRAQATAGTPVVTSRPYALVYMTSDQLGWSVDPGQLYGASFDVAGAILEPDGVTVPETELVTNGNFAGGTTTGWAGSGATLSVVGERIRVTSSAATQGFAVQNIGAIAGKTYKLLADAIAGTAPPIVYFSDGVTILNAFTTAGIGQSAIFTARASPVTIYLATNDSVAGHFADFDNISLVEA